MTTDPQFRIDRGVASKTAMLAVSRHVERLASLAAGDGPRPQVLALFQEDAYFERSRDRFARLTRDADVTVGYVGDWRAPRGVTRVALDRDEVLADEWSVLTVTGSTGAALVATDAHDVTLARTVERGRTFEYEVMHRARQIEDQVRRIVDGMGDRLPAARRDALVAAASALPRNGQRAEHADELEQVVASAVSTIEEVSSGQRLQALSGVTLERSLAALHAWVADAGARVPMLGAVALRASGSSRMTGSTLLAKTLRPELSRSTLMVAPTRDVLLVVLPGRTGSGLVEFGHAAVEAVLGACPDVRAVVGELDPRALHVSPLLLAFDRAGTDETVRAVPLPG